MAPAERRDGFSGRRSGPRRDDAGRGRSSSGERRSNSGERRGGSGPRERGSFPGSRDGARRTGGTTGGRAGGDAGRDRSESGRRSTDSDRAGRPGRPGRPASGRDDTRSGRSGGPRRDHNSSDRAARGHAPRRSDAPPREQSTRTANLIAPPENADVSLLDRGVRAELRSLSKINADAVGRYLVAAGQLLDTDPQRALTYARAARSRGGRIAAVREAVGVAAYVCGEWSEALAELRTARRISGDPRNLALIADCERALGRAASAVRALSDPDVRRLDAETRAELLIVVAGARRDLGQVDAALSVLARGGLDRDRPRPGAARLWYAYGDALVAAQRPQEAATWFAASAALDPDGELDAAERAADLL